MQQAKQRSDIRRTEQFTMKLFFGVGGLVEGHVTVFIV